MIRQAGSGRTGTVWLAVHEGLEEYRAIKCISKQHTDYNAFRREALILKELHHPGIPVVYDLEEDEDYFYLIEEYLDGHSLYTLITEQGPFQETDVIRYGIQICSLVHFMHSAYKQPILHLDLQPNNLIICSGTVRLIDFDHAADSQQANNSLQRYGTRGCAAPEQYTSDQVLDQRTDIYAIGAVLRFMAQGTANADKQGAFPLSENLEAIIEKCMEKNPEDRFHSALETGNALRRLLGKWARDQETQNPISSLSVILTGNRPGAGTTHLAFGLCRYLTSHGHTVLYEEHNPSGALRTLMAAKKLSADGYGICRFKSCALKPWYGPAACLPQTEGFEIIIQDFGCQWEDAAQELMKEQRVHIMAVCQNLWENGLLEQALEKTGALRGPGSQKTVLVMRFLQQEPLKKALLPVLKQIEGRFKHNLPVFCQPVYENPFKANCKSTLFFEELWKTVSETQDTACAGKKLRKSSSPKGLWGLQAQEEEQG